MGNIILASSSPRRKELLNILGLEFIIDSSSVDETLPEGISPELVVETLACKKANAVAEKHPNSIIIGSDTIVVVDNLILGKPVNDDDALAMILKLQGRNHQVYSGISVIDTNTGKHTIAHEITNVAFRNISEEEALRYVATSEPKGKAGSYAIQGYASIFVKRIEGDYFNVVGLPLFLLSNILNKYGVKVF